MQKLFSSREKKFLSQIDKPERELRIFICANWTALFPEYTFIKDEFPLDRGATHDSGKKGRIDILAYNPDKQRFVIFELKKDDGKDKELYQAKGYRRHIKQYFPAVRMDVQDKYKISIPKSAEANSAEIILIAKDFAEPVIFDAEDEGSLITLIRYNWFEDDLIFLDYVNNAPDVIIVNEPDEDEDDATEDTSTWSFSDLDLPVGAELVLKEDKTKKCKVVNDTQVEYEGELFLLATLAEKLLQRKVERVLLRFTYNGTTINNRRKPNRDGNKRGTVDWFKTQGWHAIVKRIEQPAEIRNQLQEIVPTDTEPTKEHIPQLREILKQRVFHVTRRAALLDLLDELEKQD